MLIRDRHPSNLLQTRSLNLCASLIRIRQHNIMRGISWKLEQDDYRLLADRLTRKTEVEKEARLEKKFAGC